MGVQSIGLNQNQNISGKIEILKKCLAV